MRCDTTTGAKSAPRGNVIEKSANQVDAALFSGAGEEAATSKGTEFQ
jgi:hypothetical protein